MVILLLNFFKDLLIITIFRHRCLILIVWFRWVSTISNKTFWKSFLTYAWHYSFDILRITCLIFKIWFVEIWRCTTTLTRNDIILFNYIFSLNCWSLTLVLQAIRIFISWNGIFIPSNQWWNLTVHFLYCLNWCFLILPYGFRRNFILWF